MYSCQRSQKDGENRHGFPMEAFGIIGMTFAIISWSLVASLKKELEDLKKKLGDSGVLT